MCSSSPDTSGMNDAARQSASTSKEALDWFKQVYANEAPDRAAATQRDNAVADAQTNAMNFATQEAKDLSQRRKTVAEPLEDQIITDARSYDTPERRAAERAAAQAGVESSFDNARQDQIRQFARQGMDLTGPAAAVLQNQQAMAKAKAVAGATYAADHNVEQQGHARMMDAAGLTKGIVSGQATQQGLATQAGQGATQATGASLQAENSGVPMMQAGYGAALQGQQIAGNLYGQAGQLQTQAKGSMMNGLAGLGQAAGYMFGQSSKRVKMDMEPMSPEEALAANNKLDVQSWKYKPGEGPAPGGGAQDDGGKTYVGPYAEDVQREFGNDVAPDGAMVNLNKMADNNAKSIQALTGELDQLEQKIAKIKGQHRGRAKPESRARAHME